MINKNGILITNPCGIDNLSDDIFFEAPCAIKSGYCNLDKPIHVGAFSYSNSLAMDNIKIGRYCSIGPNVFMGGVHPLNTLSTSPFQYDKNFLFFSEYLNDKINAPLSLKKDMCIELGNDVFIGAFAFIKPGVKIGHGAVIGAHSVVVSDIPPYAVAVGNPARIVKYRFPDDIIKRLLKLKWWEYKYTDFKNIDFSSVEKTIEQIECLIRDNNIEKYTPKDILTREEFNNFYDDKQKVSKHKIINILGVKIKYKTR